MVKSLKQLQRELNIYKARQAKIRTRQSILSQKKQIKRELFLMKHPGFQRAGNLLYSGAQKAGRGIINQGRLIKEQQERENREYSRSKKKRR